MSKATKHINNHNTQPQLNQEEKRANAITNTNTGDTVGKLCEAQGFNTSKHKHTNTAPAPSKHKANATAKHKTNQSKHRRRKEYKRGHEVNTRTHTHRNKNLRTQTAKILRLYGRS